jgi:hypothetical protein
VSRIKQKILTVRPALNKLDSGSANGISDIMGIKVATLPLVVETR